MREFTNKKGQQVIVSAQQLRGCLEEAIKTFNLYDAASLLQPRKKEHGQYMGEKEQGWGGASERAISHRLAVYLEGELRKMRIVEDGGLIVVDCEYNRHLDGVKKQRISPQLLAVVRKARRKAKRISDDSGYYVISVAPDIDVHQRGEDRLNLLVVEMKKKSNPEIPEYDEGKLKCFTKGGLAEYGYVLGFSVVAIDDVTPTDRKLELSTPYADEKSQAANYAV